MTSTLKYQPLNQSAAEIRLVRILPAVTVPANFLASELGDTPQPDLVSCQLEHFSLKDPRILASKMPLKWEDTHDISSTVISPECRYDWGTYVALSYTWGDPRDTRSVVINGHQIKVRSNLEEALRALRGKAPVHMGILIWIDALCLYFHRYRTKYHGNLRFVPLFSEALRFTIVEQGSRTSIRCVYASQLPTARSTN